MSPSSIVIAVIATAIVGSCQSAGRTIWAEVAESAMQGTFGSQRSLSE